MSTITITEAQLLAMTRESIQKEIADLRPLLQAEVLKSLQLIDEAGALEILPISGKDPRRTFRRMANKHKLECVHIDGFKWWKLSAIEKLIDNHTLNKKSLRNTGTQELISFGRAA